MEWKSSAAYNGQTKMAAQGYSDYSELLTIFKTVDRFAGEILATSFGLKRWQQLKIKKS